MVNIQYLNKQYDMFFIDLQPPNEWLRSLRNLDAYFSPVWEDIRKLLQRRDKVVAPMVAKRVAARKDLPASMDARAAVPDTVETSVRLIVFVYVYFISIILSVFLYSTLRLVKVSIGAELW